LEKDIHVKIEPGGISFGIRVQPKSSRVALAGMREGRMRLRLTAPPVDDAANDQCIAFFSRRFQRKKREIKITSGLKSRNKTIFIAGLDEKSFRQKLDLLMEKDEPG
jgi:uncharacterized protein (TIGR00251 family)